MKQLIMTIGLPFSGKSSLAKIYEGQGWKVISRDEILGRIVESPAFKEMVAEQTHDNPGAKEFDVKNKVAVDMLSAEIRRMVLDSVEDKFFYDGTNLRKSSRAGILDLTKDGVEVSAIFLKISLEEIIRRAKRAYLAQERKGEFNEIALDAFLQMLSLAEAPEENEGFHHIEIIDIVDESGKEIGTELDSLIK